LPGTKKFFIQSTCDKEKSFITLTTGGDNKYGHVATATEKYHFSIWPTKSLNNFKRQAEGMFGTPGTLVFHDALDKHYEGKKSPDNEYELANVTDAQVEKVYEDLFLRINDINPGVSAMNIFFFTTERGGK
jgi:hypothetical protein